MNNKQFKKELLKELKRIGITPKVTEKVTKTNYIAYLNTLRGLKGVIHSLHEKFDSESKIEIEEFWVKSSECTCMTPWGSAIYDKLEIHTLEPIVQCDFMHVVAIHCEDENLLKYVEWSIEKHLNELNEIKGMDEIVSENDKPTLKSLKSDDVQQFVKELFSNIHL